MNHTILPTASDIIGTTSWTRDEKIAFFENELMSTGRNGVGNIIDFIRATDFYTTPASISYHSNCPHGLLNHSILVYVNARRIKESLITTKPELSIQLPDDSITLVSLLHDICKTGLYMPTQKWKRDDHGEWVGYQGYKFNDEFPCGHGEKSVIMLQYMKLELNVEEILAIRWHMGMFNNGEGNSELKPSQMASLMKTPLVGLLQMADFSSSVMFEEIINEK